MDGANEMTLLIDVRYEPEDELYLAEARELQGCWASGPTPEAAVEAIIPVAMDYLATFSDQQVLSITAPEKIDDPAGHPDSATEVQVLASC